MGTPFPPALPDPFVWYADFPFFDAMPLASAEVDLRWTGGVYVVMDRHVFTGIDMCFYVGQSDEIGRRLRGHEWSRAWESSRLGDLVVLHHIVMGNTETAEIERRGIESLVRQELRPLFGVR